MQDDNAGQCKLFCAQPVPSHEDHVAVFPSQMQCPDTSLSLIKRLNAYVDITCSLRPNDKDFASQHGGQWFAALQTGQVSNNLTCLGAEPTSLEQKKKRLRLLASI